MAQDYVRICPVCETRNPAGLTRCPCGASLATVDFTLEITLAEPPAPAPAVETPEPGSVIVCPHADCAQPNPAGQARCLYCNRPMGTAAAPASPQVSLAWPWGESTTLGGSLVVGRDPPAPPDLAARLAREYDNVSRRHAEFSLRDGECWITDLGSLNGTYVDGQPLAANRPARLRDGQTVRFGADLSVQARVSGQAEP